MFIGDLAMRCIDMVDALEITSDVVRYVIADDAVHNLQRLAEALV